MPHVFEDLWVFSFFFQYFSQGFGPTEFQENREFLRRDFSGSSAFRVLNLQLFVAVSTLGQISVEIISFPWGIFWKWIKRTLTSVCAKEETFLLFVVGTAKNIWKVVKFVITIGFFCSFRAYCGHDHKNVNGQECYHQSECICIIGAS